MSIPADVPPRRRAGAEVVGWTAVWFAVVGLVTGLVVGLAGYPPTAWFAALEVGAPAALLGLLVGALAVGVRAVLDRGTRR